jgi:hypothetical protein
LIGHREYTRLGINVEAANSLLNNAFGQRQRRNMKRNFCERISKAQRRMFFFITMPLRPA